MLEMSETSSSGNSTPVDEKMISFSPQGMNPIKRMRSYLNKITERTFCKISDDMLQIVLLENPSEDDVIPSDKDNMEPIVQTFISNVCVFERNDEAMQVYAKVFCKLQEKWVGRQGKILTEVMMIELSKFFKDYSNIPIEEIDEKKRNSCFKLCKFVSYLYNENVVGLRLVLAILQTFFNTKKNHLEVFCKLFEGCREKLTKDEIFRSKIMDRYKNFLKDGSKSEVLEPMYRFMCLEILEKL